MVCDEGHRLKAAAGNKTISALLSLRCARRVLVTGTPLQNNLEEFYGVPLCSGMSFLCTPTPGAAQWTGRIMPSTSYPLFRMHHLQYMASMFVVRSFGHVRSAGQLRVPGRAGQPRDLQARVRRAHPALAGPLRLQVLPHPCMADLSYAQQQGYTTLLLLCGSCCLAWFSWGAPPRS